MELLKHRYCNYHGIQTPCPSGFLYRPPPPRRMVSTYCFTGVGVSVTPITKGTPAPIFLGGMFFCAIGHWLLIFAMTLTFALKVKP